MTLVTSLREMGLSPLEGRQAQAPYTDYWTDTYRPALEGITPLDAAARTRLGRAAEFVSNVTEVVIRGREMEALGVFPDFLDGRRRGYARVINAWDKTLGSLNSMVDGQGDLLRAASILLETNIDPSAGEFVGAPDNRNAYKTFSSMWRTNDVRGQYPNATLLQAAELVHKAGWTDQDTQRQERLLGVAAEMYQHVCNSETISPESKRQAQNNLSDIEFHTQSLRARTGKLRGDRALQTDANRQMEGLIRRDAGLLESGYANLSYVSGESTAQVGHLFENTVTLALRTAILSGNSPELEVRHSFDHEDHSIQGIAPKPSFDIVLQRHEPEGITATPIQIKLRSSSSPQRSPRARYLPGITYVEGKDISRDVLRRAAASMADGGDGLMNCKSKSTSHLRRLGGELGRLLEWE